MEDRKILFPKIKIHDPRSKDLGDFHPGGFIYPAWDDCLIITCESQPKAGDTNILRTMLSDSQSDKCFMHVGPLRNRKLRKIESFLEIKNQRDNYYSIMIDMTDSSIGKLIDAVKTFGVAEMWIFGLYMTDMGSSVENISFDASSPEESFVAKHALFSEIIFYDFNSSYFTLIISDRGRFDDALLFARDRLGYAI